MIVFNVFGDSSKFFSTFPHGTCPLSDSCLSMQPKVGGKLHLRLNTDTSPPDRGLSQSGCQAFTGTRRCSSERPWSRVV